MREKDNPTRWKGSLEFDLPSAIRKNERKHHEAAELEDLLRHFSGKNNTFLDYEFLVTVAESPPPLE